MRDSETVCPTCGGDSTPKDGRDRKGAQVHRCGVCRRRFTALTGTPFAGYRFPVAATMAIRFHHSVGHVRLGGPAIRVVETTKHRERHDFGGGAHRIVPLLPRLGDTLGDALVRSRVIDVLGVFVQHAPQVGLAHEQDVVQALAALAADQARASYEAELRRYQFELVRLQYWVKERGERLLLVFEGRDAAGKGGLIKRLVVPLNPRGVRLVALGKPSDIERTQWYFQRYVAHLPAAGEIVIFDRSWYNRAGVERVMGFCSEEEYREFLRACPEFERLLVRAGLRLCKYWLSVSDEEQERRFQERAGDPAKLWKLSPLDLLSRERWVDYSRAKDTLLEHTDIPEARWYQVEADDKRRAHLNCLRHLLERFDYRGVTPAPVRLKPRPPADAGYIRPPRDAHPIVPDHYAGAARDADARQP